MEFTVKNGNSQGSKPALNFECLAYELNFECLAYECHNK